jgi:Amt family ammonium transporter
MSSLAEQVVVLTATVADLQLAVDSFFVVTSAALVFFMQAGFAMLCAGSIREKNVRNIMLKNVLDAAIGSVVYYLVGFAFAYGEGGVFAGSSYFALSDLPPGKMATFFFQWAFAATAATIVAGTIAERTRMEAYLLYSIFLTGWLYPIVTRAVWSDKGWLSPFVTAESGGFQPFPLFGVGMIDFAGSGVVHLTGGTVALVAAVILGPRLGRFHDERGEKLKTPNEMPGHSVALQVLGLFVLWFGWYGFNPGSALSTSNSISANVAAHAAVTTTLSAGSGGITTLFIRYFLSADGTWDLTVVLNGILSGLVAITAGCATVYPWASVVIGFCSALVYLWFSKLLIRLRIDDAVDAIPVHFANGIWGCVACGLFSAPNLIATVYTQEQSVYAGWFYQWGAGTGQANLLAAELVGVMFIVSWCAVQMIPFFVVLRRLNLFRVDPEDEKAGLDISHHGGCAYHGSFSENSSARIVRFSDRAVVDATGTGATISAIGDL